MRAHGQAARAQGQAVRAHGQAVQGSDKVFSHRLAQRTEAEVAGKAVAICSPEEACF